MNYFFTADEHYGHKNIIKYCDRPFHDIEEMNEELLKRHNSVVQEDDIVIHAGDFALMPKDKVGQIISRLHGEHIFLQGSHDRWASNLSFLWERKLGDNYFVVCHYPMLSWPRSHHGSYLLHGHTHGRMKTYPGILDVGVDCWNFTPVALYQVERALWR